MLKHIFGALVFFARGLELNEREDRLVIVLGPVIELAPRLVEQFQASFSLGGALVGFAELLAAVRPMSSFYGANTIASFTVVAVIFIALNFALTSFASWLEARLRRGKKSTGAVLGAGDMDKMNPAAIGGTKGTGAGGGGM